MVKIKKLIPKSKSTLTKGDTNKQLCPNCGRKIKVFIHNCPNSATYDEYTGCPVCDDFCGLCL